MINNRQNYKFPFAHYMRKKLFVFITESKLYHPYKGILIIIILTIFMKKLRNLGLPYHCAFFMLDEKTRRSSHSWKCITKPIPCVAVDVTPVKRKPLKNHENFFVLPYGELVYSNQCM